MATDVVDWPALLAGAACELLDDGVGGSPGPCTLALEQASPADGRLWAGARTLAADLQAAWERVASVPASAMVVEVADLSGDAGHAASAMDALLGAAGPARPAGGAVGVDEALFVLQILLVMAALAGGTTLEACARSGGRGLTGMPDTNGPVYEPGPALGAVDVATGLVVPALAAHTKAVVAAAAPAEGPVGGVTGFPGDADYEAALRTHLVRDVAARALADEVARHCGRPATDVAVARLCALVGSGTPGLVAGRAEA